VTGLSPDISVHPCQFHSTSAPYSFNHSVIYHDHYKTSATDIIIT